MTAPSPGISGGMPMGVTRSASLYANETFTSFFRRLTFAPDGSLLFTPAGQQKEAQSNTNESSKSTEDTNNMTYIYTRAGLNKPPVAKLPGHKKPSLAVRCSPIFYNLRIAPMMTKEITIDTSSNEADADLSALPDPVMPSRQSHNTHLSTSSMDPPPPINAPSPAQSSTAPSPKHHADSEGFPNFTASAIGPHPTFDLPYRIVYAVATQDAVHVYDTQQKQALCVVSNLHYATFTDLTWTSDGATLLISSSDGFCSSLNFTPGELGSSYVAPAQAKHAPTPINTSASSAHTTPAQTPTQSHLPQLPRPSSSHGQGPPQTVFPTHPASPARSMSISSVTTQEFHAQNTEQSSELDRSVDRSTPQISSVPGITATSPGLPSVDGMPMFTPPQTPGPSMPIPTTNQAVGGSLSAGGQAFPGGQSSMGGVKRESEGVEESSKEKRRRIQPTLVTPSQPAVPSVPSASDSDPASTHRGEL